MGLIGELVVKITGNTAALNKSIDASQKRLQKLSAGFVKAGKTLTKSLTLPIVALGAVSVRAFGKQAEAEAKLNAAIRATGKESEISAENIKTFAAELQKTTLFGDEATISATALLQSFANLNEQGLKQIIPGILDMSAAMGISLETAATLVGKTLGSTTNALSRYGIIVDASADKSEKLADIADQLRDKFGGTAEEIATTGVGSLKQLQNTLGDVAETIGEIIIPVLNDIIAVIKSWADAFNILDDDSKKMIVTILAIAAGIGPLILIVGKLIGVFAALGASLAINPLFVAVGAIVALGLAIGVLAGSIRKDAVPALKDQLKFQKQLTDEFIIYEEQLKNTKEAIEGLSAAEQERRVHELQAERDELKERLRILEEGKNARLNNLKEILALSKRVQELNKEILDSFLETAKAHGEEEKETLEKRKEAAIKAAEERQDAIIELEQEHLDTIREIRAQSAQDAIDLRNGITAAIIDANQKEIDDAKAAAEAKKVIDQAVADSTISLMQSVFSIIGSLGRENAELQKAIAIFQATLNAAVAISNVIATVPFFAWPIAIAAAIAAGTAQIAAIASTPIPSLAEGGVFRGPALIGEVGPEVALPLTDEVFGRLAAAIETAKTSGIVNQLVDDRPIDLSVGVNIDGRRLNAYISGESRNGRIIIDRSRGITKK